MQTKFVKVLKPTVLRVVDENEREHARRVRPGDDIYQIPADDLHGLVNTGRVAAVDGAAPAPTPKQRAKARQGAAAGKAGKAGKTAGNGKAAA